MTVSAPSLTKKPGVVPAACQYMENVFALAVKAQRESFHKTLRAYPYIKVCRNYTLTGLLLILRA